MGINNCYGYMNSMGMDGGMAQRHPEHHDRHDPHTDHGHNDDWSRDRHGDEAHTHRPNDARNDGPWQRDGEQPSLQREYGFQLPQYR